MRCSCSARAARSGPQIPVIQQSCGPALRRTPLRLLQSVWTGVGQEGGRLAPPSLTGAENAPTMTPRMAKKTIEERLAYLGLDPEDLKLLSELRPVLDAHVDDIVDAFHRQLLLFPETRRLFLEPHVKERFVAGRRHYMMSLADTQVGDDYLR